MLIPYLLCDTFLLWIFFYTLQSESTFVLVLFLCYIRRSLGLSSDLELLGQGSFWLGFWNDWNIACVLRYRHIFCSGRFDTFKNYCSTRGQVDCDGLTFNWCCFFILYGPDSGRLDSFLYNSI